MASAVDVAGYPDINLANNSTGPFMNALNMQNKIDDILGIANANSAFNADEANRANQLQNQWYNQQMAYNANEAAKNREWQEYMSNTAHLRETRDLIAAGLNPVLSATGGQGAAVGSGASASVSVPSAQKGQADTSGTAAIVSLLGHSLDAMTQIANTNTNAMANMAIADKYNAVSKWSTEVNRQTQLDVADIYGLYGLKQAATSGSYNLAAANAAAWGNVTSAGISAEAAKYAADMNFQGNNYRTNMDHAIAKLYTEAQKYGIDAQYDYNYWKTALETQCKYDGNLVAALSNCWRMIQQKGERNKRTYIPASEYYK